ncbi:hypothetical protein [Brucella haematophila]|uniref:Uncharacterized protein n=1 Tax=Brucella haematophila TaxID=419474 RepID=A0ABX1DMS7_9HYPH|nr:hypothetical protein [Brucella haematophila]NKC04266.1 hypothetical protein [Brucella haematophila]TMV06115.1 hypothetical protein FGI60_02055 [Brucella haematophila]
MKLVLAGLALIALSATVHAEEFNAELTAINFGTILAAEEPCGMSYEPAAIEKYVADNVPAEDVGFPATLTRWTRMQKSRVGDMTPSEKVAYCATARQTAAKLGFVKQ